MKNLFLLFLSLLISTALQAQLERIIHDEFEVEEVSVVNLDLYGEYEVVPWAGNKILVETKIELYSATNAILNHFIEAGRYKIDLLKDTGEANMVSIDMERRPIRTRSGECSEYVSIRLFVPEDFNTTQKNLLSREIQITKSTDDTDSEKQKE